jgi:cytochrome P450
MLHPQLQPQLHVAVYKLIPHKTRVLSLIFGHTLGSRLQIRKERAAIAADKAKGVLSAQRNKKILRRLLIEKDDNGRGLSDEEAADNMLNLLFAG